MRYAGLGLIAIAGVALLWLARDWLAPAPPTVPEAGPREVSAEPTPKAVPPRVEVAAEPRFSSFTRGFLALTMALHDGEATTGPAAAAALRGLLRTDEAAMAEAIATLLADEVPPELRRALALVLGTLAADDVDTALLAALDRFAADEATVCCLLAALGAQRTPPDEDDVFDLAAAPHFGFAGPGGIGITVRNVVTDPRAADALRRHLLDRERADVRRIAAAALRFSLDDQPNRTRFLVALQAERVDDVAGTLGQSLAEWVRHRDGAEVQQITGALVAAAGQPGFDEYRLRLERALQGAAIDADVAARLAAWSGAGQPFELRAWACTMLARRRELTAGDRARLEGIARADADRATRDHVIGLLAELPPSPSSAAVLRAVFEHDADWSLRSSALAALAATLPKADAERLLDEASRDPDERIARRAQRLLPGVRARR